MLRTHPAMVLFLMAAACSGGGNDDDDGPTTLADDDDVTTTANDDDTEPECVTADCPGDQICKDNACANPTYPVLVEGAEEAVTNAATGRNVLINGRLIRPASVGVEVGTLPTNIEISPDGLMLVVNENGFGTRSVPDVPNSRRHMLRVIDPETMEVKQTLNMPGRSMFHGLRFSADGSRLYVAGGQDGMVHVYNVTAEHHLEFGRSIAVPECYTTDIVLDASESRLYTSCTVSGKVAAVDLSGDLVLGLWNAGVQPYTLALTPDGSRLWVTNWKTVIRPANGDTLTVLDTADGSLAGAVNVGLGPEGLVFSKDRTKLYSIASKTDEVVEVDVATLAVTRRISLHADPAALKGIQPLMGTLSPDGTTLYVASSGDNGVDIVDLASGTVKGRLPTEWYTTDVAVSPDGATLYATNGKGKGNGPSGGGDVVMRQLYGSVNRIVLPSGEALDEATQMVEENNRRPVTFFDMSTGNDTALPADLGSGPSPIRHVFLIMKENQTYDSILGDLEGTNGDPGLALYPEAVTPNHHKLAREFAVLDAFFCPSGGSVDGHQWASTSAGPDYVEKTWTLNYAGFDIPESITGIDPGSYPESRFLLPHFLAYGHRVRAYGVLENFAEDIQNSFDHFPLDYPPVVSLTPRDREKAQMFINDFEMLLAEDRVPALTILSLPNDHTRSVSPGNETPQSMVADNDEGLGMIVQAIASSPVWESSFIFVFEDDPQHAYDHVDGHRTVGIAIGPWVRRGHVSSVPYTFSNLHKTAGLALGVPPMTRFDELAGGMHDLFVAKPDFTPYTMAPRTYPEEVVGGLVDAKIARIAGQDDLGRIDNAPHAAEAAWRYIKGTPPPGHAKTAFGKDDEEGER